MTQEQAIADLKKAKELLDLEIITQEEYDKIKVELLPSLRVGFGNPQSKVEEKSINELTFMQGVEDSTHKVDSEAKATADVVKSKPTTKLDKNSSSEFAIIALIIVIVLILICVVANFDNIENSKKESTVQSKPIATALTKRSAPVVTPATESEIAAAWSQWLKLYDELGTFKKKSDFHNYGLSSASPYHNWAKRVDDLGQSKGGKELLGRYEVSAYDLTQVALQYISSKGKDNDYTNYIAGIVKKKKQKKIVKSEPVVEEVVGTQPSGKEVIIGQWRVTNKYVNGEYDVIIKKEGSKYYAYKAGNKKQVSKEGNKYYEIDNEWGEYYYVTSDGNMKFGDEDGLVSPEVGYIIVKK